MHHLQQFFFCGFFSHKKPVLIFPSINLIFKYNNRNVLRIFFFYPYHINIGERCFKGLLKNFSLFLNNKDKIPVEKPNMRAKARNKKTKPKKIPSKKQCVMISAHKISKIKKGNNTKHPTSFNLTQ